MQDYTFPEMLLGTQPGQSPTSIEIAESVTKQIVSKDIRRERSDALNGRIDIKVSDVTDTTGISAILQSYSAATGTWVDTKSAAIEANGLVSITYNIEVAGDQTHLPLHNTVRVVITTGADDAVTVDSVRASCFG